MIITSEAILSKGVNDTRVINPIKLICINNELYAECKNDFALNKIDNIQGGVKIKSRYYIPYIPCNCCGRILSPYINV